MYLVFANRQNTTRNAVRGIARIMPVIPPKTEPQKKIATMIAIGTSLPELASTVAAALRGLGDIAIGNVIGSNVFNLGLVLGTAAVLNPLTLTSSAVVSLVLPALIFSIMLIPLALSKEQVGRWEGGFLLAGYIGYIAWIL